MPQDHLPIIPKPYQSKRLAGDFTLTADTAIVASESAEPVAKALQAAVAPATGLPLPIVRESRAKAITLVLDEHNHDLGCEGYSLKAGADGVEIRAPRAAGLFYGVQTLRQLLPPQVFRRAKVEGVNWEIPACEVVDHPRLPWRGAHLDVSRHFMPKAFILKWIDLMAIHKLNIFHWHIVDSHGWRMEVKKYPELALQGSKTDYSETNPKVASRSLSREPGGYYTQDDVREVVAYAADRFITVLPEIELPGHSHAALKVYPHLGNAVQIKAAGGDTSFMGDPPREEVFNVEDEAIQFFKDVLDETLELFPSAFIHIGGDEVEKEPWQHNPRAQERMKKEGLKDEQELQSWFIRQMDAYLQSKGRRLVGWDEILEGGLAEGATVMSWRGEEGGIKAAKAGHDVVMAPGTHTYLDHYQSRLRHREPLGIGGFTNTVKAYAYEPIPKELTLGEAIHVLGAQFQLWSEWLPHPSHVEYMTYPRGCALAETFWSDPEGRDYKEFEPRLIEHLKRLKIADVHFRPLSPEPEPIGAVEFKAGEKEKAGEWALPAGNAGRHVFAFATNHNDREYTVRDVEIVEAGKTVAKIESLKPTDPHKRGCEVALDLPKLSVGAKLRAKVALEGGKGFDGSVFLFAEAAG